MKCCRLGDSFVDLDDTAVLEFLNHGAHGALHGRAAT